MEIKIKFFGSLSELTGKNELIVSGIQDIKMLDEHLTSTYPALHEQNYVFAVKDKICNEAFSLDAGETVAVLPPFAGG